VVLYKMSVAGVRVVEFGPKAPINYNFRAPVGQSESVLVVRY